MCGYGCASVSLLSQSTYASHGKQPSAPSCHSTLFRKRRRAADHHSNHHTVLLFSWSGQRSDGIMLHLPIHLSRAWDERDTYDMPSKQAKGDHKTRRIPHQPAKTSFQTREERRKKTPVPLQTDPSPSFLYGKKGVVMFPVIKRGSLHPQHGRFPSLPRAMDPLPTLTQGQGDHVRPDPFFCVRLDPFFCARPHPFFLSCISLAAQGLAIHPLLPCMRRQGMSILSPRHVSFFILILGSTIRTGFPCRMGQHASHVPKEKVYSPSSASSKASRLVPHPSPLLRGHLDPHSVHLYPPTHLTHP